MKRVLSLFIACLMALSVVAEIVDIRKPRLVVFITIDGLKSDHFYRLYDRFSDGGFKKIIDDGCFWDNVEFNYISKNPVVDIASICTSTTPKRHGIISDKLYSDKTHDFYSIIEDKGSKGIYCSVGRSPRNLQSTTFSDMLKLAYPQSKVISIGLNPEKTIVMAGHNPDGVVWIDSEVSLASSDYYKQMPIWATEFNASGLINNYLKSVWRPMKPMHQYMFLPYNDKNGAFYSPDTSKDSKYLMERFLFTPYANSAVNQLAQQAIKREKLGQGSQTDILCLNYNVNTFFNQSSELNTAEKEDLYLSLDRDISILLRVIAEEIKMDNALIVFAGTQTEPFSQNTLNKNNMPTGRFDAKRYMALLNSFLMARYGQARWVLNYADGNVFLNHKEIDRKNVDRKKLLHSAIEFLSSIDGINTVVSVDDISGAVGDIHNVNVRLNQSVSKKRSGDLILVFSEGWVDVDIDGVESSISSSALQRTPVAFYGLNIKSKRISQRYFVTDIASTICHIMQISSPSSSIGEIMSIR